MASVDTVSFRWQRDICEQSAMRSRGWLPRHDANFGHINKWTFSERGSNKPRLTWSQPGEHTAWLTAELSIPYLAHGTNARDADDADVDRALDLVTAYVSEKSGVDCDARRGLVGRVDYAANFNVGEKQIPLYLEAALRAKVSRFCPPYRESSTAVGLDTGGARKIQIYGKHADVLDKIGSGRLVGSAAREALKASLGILRLESRFKNNKTVTRLAKRLGVERTADELLNRQTADKVIAMELEQLSLDKPIEPEAQRFEALLETFGDFKTVADLHGFLAYRDRFGDDFYKIRELGISRAVYFRKMKILKDAGLWLSAPANAPLPSLRLQLHNSPENVA